MTGIQSRGVNLTLHLRNALKDTVSSAFDKAQINDEFPRIHNSLHLSLSTCIVAIHGYVMRGTVWLPLTSDSPSPCRFHFAQSYHCSTAIHRPTTEQYYRGTVHLAFHKSALQCLPLAARRTGTIDSRSHNPNGKFRRGIVTQTTRGSCLRGSWYLRHNVTGTIASLPTIVSTRPLLCPPKRTMVCYRRERRVWGSCFSHCSRTSANNGRP
jgi:hypothetical protein